jgi:hypothetical protein
MGRNRNASRPPVADLRRTIDCLPVRTREAMLEGVRSHERIIVGAYTDRYGGICPMLAAHRRGGRTNFLSFARSWDRFTRAGRKVRQATRRELTILIAHLEASLLSEAPAALGRAIEEHRALGARRVARQADPAGEILAARLCVPRCARPGRQPVATRGGQRGVAGVNAPLAGQPPRPREAPAQATGHADPDGVLACAKQRAGDDRPADERPHG